MMLYGFFRATGWGENAGKTQTVTSSEAAVSLPLTGWKLNNFKQDEYRLLYENLVDGTVRVERYSDVTTLPDTPNVAVDIEN